MAKHTSSTKLKGELDFIATNRELYTEDGEKVEVLVLEQAIITEIVKEEEKPYDLTKVLSSYHGKVVAFSVSEDKDLEPIE